MANNEHINIDPSTTKYLIQARLNADGIVEKPDVVGAIFGQTEGLLGEELDLRDLQKGGRIGRIEVDVSSKMGKSEGTILIPSSLDQIETAILASSLETIDRIGPCKAKITVESLEDVRITKRNKIIDRSKELLLQMSKQSKTSGLDLLEAVRQNIKTDELTYFGKERLPAGPNAADSDAIIIVEGRSDVINLLKCGIKNTIAVEGTNIPKSVQEISKEKVVTAFVDGDRGGELILKELLQVADVDFIARAPKGQEVEELTQKQVMKCLRNKMPTEQYVEMYGLNVQTPDQRERESMHRKKDDNHHPKQAEVVEKRGRQDEVQQEEGEGRASVPQTATSKMLSDIQENYKEILNSLTGNSKAVLLDTSGNQLSEVPVRELVNNLREIEAGKVSCVIFDGIITQRILDIASEKKIGTVVASKLGSITKQPDNVGIWVKEELS
ncbi:MAG: DNA primase [Thermoplasmata archaeon YP2-bin.285]|uniref:DNA primase DnaG n=1 Tax=Candidatus Sysuiplasma superficiale TaxID=2823368 RepID=A0A8J7YQC0_9ARCH|nr:DNA primase [Candidatus Sysuiplasma superficiale]